MLAHCYNCNRATNTAGRCEVCNPLTPTVALTPSTTPVPVEMSELRLRRWDIDGSFVTIRHGRPIKDDDKDRLQAAVNAYVNTLAAAPQPVQGIAVSSGRKVNAYIGNALKMAAQGIEAEELARLIRAAVGKLGDVIWSLAKGTGTEAEATQWEVRTANEILAILSRLTPIIAGEGGATQSPDLASASPPEGGSQ